MYGQTRVNLAPHPGCLALLVTTLSHYGLQTADMNISLSAIALLWTIVDFLSQDAPVKAGDPAHAYVRVATTQTGTATQTWTQTHAYTNTPIQAVHRVTQRARSESTPGERAKLWLGVFREMKTLCLDPRAETRNCALVTLFKAVATHGPSLTQEIWSALFAQVLSPLLGEARAASERANTEETVAELGKDQGGKSVKMCDRMVLFFGLVNI